MSPRLRVYLAVALGWAALAGGLLSITGIDLGSIAGAVLIAVFYMPSPMVAALIAERGLRRGRLGLPRRGRPAVPYFLLPAEAVVMFVLLLLGSVLLGGNVLHIDALGRVVVTADQIMAGAASVLGQEAVDAAGPPPPAAVLLLAGLWGALVAGWTINGVFAMGEEYGWRGLMWDELRTSGPVRANLLIGLAWGLWHAPLIVQGYNYPGFPALGVLAMVAFCIGMSFVLTAVRELTGSLIPVAATRGMFNGIAPLLLILTPDAHPILAGPLGLLGTAILALLGAAAWTVARRRTGLGRTRRLSHRRAPRPPAAATRPAGGMDDSPVREAGAACRIPYHERRTSASSADGQKQRESRLEPAFEPLQFNWQGTEPRRRSRRLRTPVPY